MGLHLRFEIDEVPDGANSRSLSGAGWLYRADGGDSIAFAAWGFNSRDFELPAFVNFSAHTLGSQTWGQVRARLTAPDTLRGVFLLFPESADLPQWLAEAWPGSVPDVPLVLTRE